MFPITVSNLATVGDLGHCHVMLRVHGLGDHVHVDIRPWSDDGQVGRDVSHRSGDSLGVLLHDPRHVRLLTGLTHRRRLKVSQHLKGLQSLVSVAVRSMPFCRRCNCLCRSTMSISMSAMVAAEQLVDEGAVHLVTEERVPRSSSTLRAHAARAAKVDDDGCAVARCRFRCLQWAVLAPQNN